jgi:hypothetical protein
MLDGLVQITVDNYFDAAKIQILLTSKRKDQQSLFLVLVVWHLL